jgi:radical SAM protein with 4Fe4S-binding SPASM domain
MPSATERRLRLATGVVPRRLESPSLYHIGRDELYELSPDAFDFITRVANGEDPALPDRDRPFVDTCLAEGLLETGSACGPPRWTAGEAPRPSLRYLELLLTDRCNLRCRHCYRGEAGGRDLPVETAWSVAREFEAMQGLRLLLSGGEPLMHPGFWDLNERLPDIPVRSVLLSNGTLIDDAAAAHLRVHEVQLSIDGTERGHDLLRGAGTYRAVLAAMERLQQRDVAVSVATMVHAGNLDQFDDLGALLEERGVKEWGVDVPCRAGRLADDAAPEVPVWEAAALLRFGWGGGVHGEGAGMACGAHLCAVTPAGAVAKCGLYASEPVGSVAEGLRTCWGRVPRLSLDRLDCRCDQVADCRGGCRYRAELDTGPAGADIVQCYARGVLKGGERA